ncbi:hypothetical protein [Pseudovibrio flavus]|uniref:hypothetical protein n=1 Tax=Pseudovibrio flavus TaxID=2529854 RepID=UPI0012BC6DA7|nr:hypothetical protein [Pseudovibrio flavus]
MTHQLGMAWLAFADVDRTPRSMEPAIAMGFTAYVLFCIVFWVPVRGVFAWQEN